MRRKTLLEDTFKYETVPFKVIVEEREYFISGKSGEVRKVNLHGTPAPYRRKPNRSWKVCDCIIARVRPDYPYSIDKEWPDDIDKHAQAVDPLEYPVRQGFIRGWTTEEREREFTAQELAEQAIEKLKRGYEERDEIQTLDSEVTA